MTSQQQRAALQRQIWAIANDVRGAVDGWDFKQYVLGTLFYRFISENFAAYIEGGDDSVNYAKLSDIVITPEIRDDAVKTKGYFIYPSQLFVNVAAKANTNESLNTNLAKIFSLIEASAIGYPSERDIRGLFADFDTTSNRLGNTVKDKNARLASVLKGVPNLFYGTTIAVNILVLSKHKTDTATQFIDASGLFKKETNNNILLDDHIDQIMAVFDSKTNVDHFAQSIPFEKVAANDYNLSVSSYIDAKDNREVVDIAKLNAELKTTVAKIDRLRKDIDAIVAEIEGEGQEA